jgi:PEGA domain
MDIPPEVSPVKHSHASALSTGSANYVRDSRFSVISTAAGTSAIVSLLTLWLWTPVIPHVDNSAGTVSVTYELLDSEHPQDGRIEDTTDVTEPDAGLIATKTEAAVVPVSRSTRAAANDPRARSESQRRAAEDDRDAVPSSAAAVGLSRIVIVTEPAGASVTINGVGYGTTPLTIPYLPPGAKRIRVTKSGYQTEERFYSSDASRASSLRITLRETPRNATR